MTTRIVTAGILVLLKASLLIAQQNDPVAKVGDMIILRMTGDVAKEYAKRVSAHPEVALREGLRVELAAMVVQVLPDDTLAIRFSHILQDQQPPRLVLLTGKIDSRKITTDITPKGTKVFPKPGAEPTVTTEDYKNLRFDLSDWKGVKLRIWTLVDEIGE